MILATSLDACKLKSYPLMANEAHVRIDEGIKRGPRKPKEAPRRSPKADLGGWLIPADLNPHEVLERYLTEATTSQIASQYGLSRKALVKWLRQVVPEEWKQVQLVRAHVNLETGEEGIDTAEIAESAISLACARERIKAAQWRLQALDKDYQPKQEVTVVNEVRIETVLDGEACALLGKMLAQSVVSNTHCTAIEGQSVVIPITSESTD